MARLADVQGDVEVDLRIDETGKVVSASAVSGHAILRREAENNSRLWEFSAIPGGGQLRVIFHFKLEGHRVAFSPEPKVEFELPTSVFVTTMPAQIEPSSRKSGTH